MPTSHQLTIRTAAEADLDTILDLYESAGLGGDTRIDLQKAQAMLEKIMAYPDYRLYVAIDEAAATVGTYALLMMDNIAHGGRPLAVVEQVAVASNQRGRGVGTAMMQHAMSEAKATGCYKLQLSSNTRFKDAHKFYDKLGFTRHGYSFYVDL
ncbi:MAG: GNAT family N-acetyltransferase [Hyphomicrobiaceae bacterium]